MSTLQATRHTIGSTNDHGDHTDRSRAKIVHSDDLLQGRRELWIEHGEDMYRLRLTSAGKLYLTK